MGDDDINYLLLVVAAFERLYEVPLDARHSTLKNAIGTCLDKGRIDRRR